ncbi:MAG: septal ring lytic transglycosylase RlpA family protein [Burkholderiaceae bacterium]
MQHGLTPCPKLLPWPCREETPRCLANYFFLKVLKTIFSSIVFASLALAPLSAEARSRCGLASFYGGDGDGFAGKTMANGRPMNPWAMITAHPSLPLGSKIKVTNRANGKTVILRVTDRGPYAYDRVLDLSYGAFAKLARPSQGLASVCYTVV